MTTKNYSLITEAQDDTAYCWITALIKLHSEFGMQDQHVLLFVRVHVVVAWGESGV